MADHLPQSCAEIKIIWSYTSFPLICRYSLHRNKLTFTFTCEEREINWNARTSLIVNGADVMVM
jgi:hypothetical protein